VTVAAATHRPRTLTFRDQLVDEALEQMRQRLGDPDLGLNDVAKSIGTSRRSLQRAFTGRGLAWRDELRRTRMDVAAAALLRDPRASVRTIAISVGYLQPAQFAKAFRRQFGVNPSAYREMHGHAGGLV
jgi:transcriptional regulator GlxA family with amidase domain